MILQMKVLYQSKEQIKTRNKQFLFHEDKSFPCYLVRSVNLRKNTSRIVQKHSNKIYKTFLTFVIKFFLFNLGTSQINVPIFMTHQSNFSVYSASLFYRFSAKGKTTSSNRSLKQSQKGERERRPVARPMRCAPHDYLPNLEYNFLISYKIQSTSTLPSRTSSQSTLRRFPSLSGFCARNKRNKDDEENVMWEGKKKREREGKRG